MNYTHGTGNNSLLTKERKMDKVQVCAAFAEALFNLIAAASQAKCDVTEKATGLCPPSEVKEVKEKKAAKWPKRFTDWAEGRTDDWTKVACKTWNKDKVNFIVPGVLIEFVNSTIEEVKAELKELSGNAELEVIVTASAVVEAKPAKAAKVVKEEKKEEKLAVTADQVKAACAALASKMKSKDKVIEIVKQFGANKVDDVPADKYPAMLAAITAATETSNQTSENSDGF